MTSYDEPSHGKPVCFECNEALEETPTGYFCPSCSRSWLATEHELIPDCVPCLMCGESVKLPALACAPCMTNLESRR